jgi:hypothetical protein
MLQIWKNMGTGPMGGSRSGVVDFLHQFDYLCRGSTVNATRSAPTKAQTYNKTGFDRN